MADYENKINEQKEIRHKMLKQVIKNLEELDSQESERYYHNSMLYARVLPGKKIVLPRRFTKYWKIKPGQFIAMPSWNEKVLIIPVTQPTKKEIEEMQKVD